MRYTIALIILVFIVLVTQWEDIWLNAVVVLTLQRGVISQNCFWWSVNDLFNDSTGTELFKQIKDRGRFVPLNILGKQIYLITQIRDITQLFQESPNPFGPGTLKKNFFNGFIPKNVGISVNPEWKQRRDYNDVVLEPKKTHSMALTFNEYIKESFEKQNPKSFEEFTELTRKLTSKIIFGTYDYNETIYRVFKQADSIVSIRFDTQPVDPNDLKEYREYMKQQAEHPTPNTLMFMGQKHHTNIPMDDILDQIPHWVFPIAGLFNVHLPRLLVVLSNHPDHLKIVSTEIEEETHLDLESHCRKCILELFRLNNPVNSTFRRLTEPFQFKDSDETFDTGTEFVFFNNPVLRDTFDKPNQFVPSRWTKKLEDSEHAVMFNHGNQQCPGKELVVTLLTLGLANYLRVNKYQVTTNIKIDTSFIPYILNPCTIRFQ
jgi:cytochrome P450